MTIYSFSKLANYTHIHMYVFFITFTNEVKKRKLEDSNYRLDVSVDGNVAKWVLNTPEKRVLKIFKGIMQNFDINAEIINEAISRINLKNRYSSELKDIRLLIKEISNVIFTKKKPEITDDSLLSPAIDFIIKDGCRY